MTLADHDALIFDCDGTLVLTADLHFTALAAAFARQRAALPRVWYDVRTGLGREDLVAAWIRDNPGALDADRAIAESISLTLTAVQGCREHGPVADLARRCHGRMPMAVASNAEDVVLRAVLASCGLDRLFDPILSVTEARVAKPDPTMFLMAAERMGVTARRCLVLEDSDQGLQAAAAAGMPALDVRRAEALAAIANMATAA